MTLQQLITTVIDSRSDDWIYDDERQTWVYALDLDVRFEGKPVSLKAPKAEEFHEPWAKRYPSSHAFRANFKLWYRNSMVRDYFFIDVDGHRALLPLPRSQDQLIITLEQERVARILNRAHRDQSAYFNRYIERFEVDEAAELRPV